MMDASIQPFFVVPADASLDANAELLGSKAAQLARMSRLGLPVPPAFLMPTSLCNGVNQKDGAALQTLKSGLRLGIARLEAETSRRFGDSRLPLFVSVRSGAARSMPGMLDTILDVGMNNDTVQGLIRLESPAAASRSIARRPGAWPRTARQSYWFGASLRPTILRGSTPPRAFSPWLGDAPLTRRWWRANLARPVWLDATVWRSMKIIAVSGSLGASLVKATGCRSTARVAKFRAAGRRS
jgi:hypothetical protein